MTTESSLLLAVDSQEEDVIHFDSKTAWKEAKTLGSLAWPVSIANLLQFTITSASVFSLGHVGTDYLAASALAIMLCNVTGNCVAQGMASALDTLCSQSFTGSNDKHSLGKHLQRGLFVCLLLCIPIAVLWYNAEVVLLLLGQDPQISALAGDFTRWMIPGLYPVFINECLRRYLQCQGIMKPSMYITGFAAVLSMFLQWLLVWSSINVGPMGAPIATSIVNIFVPSVTVIYIRYFEGAERWGGFDMNEIFDYHQLVEIFKLGLPGVAMIASEWLAFEAVALAAGILGNHILAAQTIVLNTCSLMYMLPLGLSVATTTRIGNCLGAKLPNTSRGVAMTALLFSLGLAAFNASFFMIVREYWGYLFTSDPQVVQLVSDVFPLAALYQLSDNTGAIGGAAMRGCGLQKYGAIINLTGYYIIGLPVGLFLTFYNGMGLFGLWLGLTLGLLFVSTAQVIILFRMDWDYQAEVAAKRVGGYQILNDEEDGRTISSDTEEQ
ncbi:mate-domain-containing protein [Globomyces pollinis-pini]|nr:mate-domain-containing protein [Globomyces pollinis-pini]